MDENLLLEISENETLHWSYRDYTEFPKELETGNKVEDLYMKQNKINTIPKWINKMVNLCILQLHGNKIKEIPEEIGLLKNLSRLDLGCNSISYLPDSIKYLLKLHELNLENNTLIKLPIEIGFLKKLRVLIIQNNKLIEIPKTIGCCLNLEEIHLQNNNITKLPNNIVFLPNLTKLIVEGNNLLYFPSIDFCNQPYIGYAKNKSLNYLSHDFYLYLLDKLQFQRYYRINLVCENIISNEKFYDTLPNIMIELLYCGKRTIIILPEMLKKVFSDTEITNNYVPSLRETLLHKIYDNTLSDNKTMYYYKMNDNILPKQIKDLFLNGPTARCNYCRRFIFTECIIWILQRLIHCSVCVEEDILIVVYFCSRKCCDLFKNEEISCTDEINKLSPMKIKWTRIK